MTTTTIPVLDGVNNENSKINEDTIQDSNSTVLPSVVPLTLVETYIDTYGRNYWEIIHLEAFKITIDEMANGIDIVKRRREFINVFEYLIKNMKCSCRNHAYHILMINPHTRYKYMYQYTVDFHNQVNMRLSRPIFTYEEALTKYIPIIKQV